MNPRRSLVAGVIWLVVGLAAVFSIAATLWVGNIARDSVIAQHMRRLSLETDQLSSALSQAFAARLSALRVTEMLLHGSGPRRQDDELRKLFTELQTAYPQMDWLAIAGIDGILIDGIANLQAGIAASMQPWAAGGLEGPWIGLIDGEQHSMTPPTSEKSSLGGVAAPVHDASGRVIGVICARLSWSRTENHPQRLTDEIDGFGNAKAFLLDKDGKVVVGPRDLVGREWPGTRVDSASTLDADPPAGPHWEKLPDGGKVLVARERVSLAPDYPSLNWFVQLSEPKDRAYQRADSVAFRIFWASSLLGTLTAFLGIIAARQLTSRLRRLADSVIAAGRSDSSSLEVPPGGDEVAQLGAAFATILGELHRERNELERRVAVRTREVERLAEDARYAAIARERLKIGRDLHDTLAHSMMAILSEIRYLRRLQARDPQSMATELERAEEIAREGLKEARGAITQMRANTVRETGLGEALAREVERCVTRTGIAAELSIDSEAARFADDRAETLLRMAQEAIRNIERHSMATTMTLKLRLRTDRGLILQIEDNGVGFDPLSENPGHYGLVGLREQADLIGAQLLIESQPSGGTALSISIDLSPEHFGADPNQGNERDCTRLSHGSQPSGSIRGDPV